jgi:hypothetical protein
MSEREWFAVYLPSGFALQATVSPSAQEACAKALMMDIPPGCRVDRYGKAKPAPPPTGSETERE